MRERRINIIMESGSRKTMVESRPISDLPKLLEEKESSDEIKKSLLAKIRDSKMLDSALDMLSAFGVGLEASGAVETGTGVGAAIGLPSLGIGAAISLVADLINAIRTAARGDYIDSAMYVMFSVPVLGDAMQATKGTSDTKKMLEPVLKWMRDKSNSSKKEKVLKAAKTLVDIGTAKVPGAEKHAEPLKKAIVAITTGDPDEISRVAKDSGKEIAEKEISIMMSKGSKDSAGPGDEGDSDRSKGGEDNLSESFRSSRRTLSMRPLYKGNLY